MSHLGSRFPDPALAALFPVLISRVSPPRTLSPAGMDSEVPFHLHPQFSDHMSCQDGTHRAGYLLAFLTRALVGFWSLGAGLGNGIKCHLVQQLAQT